MSFNLDYIYKLSKGDSSFIDQFWSLIKKEWPQETAEYRRLISEKEFKDAASLVHKLKHKFVLLGAAEGHDLAGHHEKSLREGDSQYTADYEKMLIELTQFINTTNPHEL